MQILKQNKNFISRELKFSDTKLFFKTSKLGSENELDISFESLIGEKVSRKTSNTILLLISISIYFISLILFIAKQKGADVETYAWIFWSIIATISLYYYWSSKEDLWNIKLENSAYISIHKNVPNKDTVDDFLEKLIDARNSYLKENYLILDQNLNYENQLNNLKWLKAIQVIDKTEFNEKYDELKELKKPNKKIIGFEK